MEHFNQYQDIKNAIDNHEIILLFGKSNRCTVCDAVLPKIQQIVKKHSIYSAIIAIEDVPEFSGQFSVFTAPTVLLFALGKEVFRQSRFILFEELEKEIIKWRTMHAEGEDSCLTN